MTDEKKEMSVSPTGALRDNKGKPSLSRMPFILLEAFATVLFRNSIKGGGRYPDGNWKKGAPYSVPLDSCLRHGFRRSDGEKIDPEDGLPHSWKMFVNSGFLVYYEWRYPELDDLNDARELPKQEPKP